VGLASLWTLLLGGLSPGFLVAVMTPHCQSLLDKKRRPQRREGYHRLIPEHQSQNNVTTGRLRLLTVSFFVGSKGYLARFVRPY
jgi:hypothetical protein